ncbi:AI-2E family transporter [Nitratireductor basaltis]|uniref:Permease n=1 Tax=Nitratireductor basaltis TaxID=472175 RepID=A0A084UAZ8_9HYPH|nr:AI-2E family transporter [Nitratireductor basaltis]KFB10134.1 hypothetical protein EL18_01164 [Nitratireductor basaltis]
MKASKESGHDLADFAYRLFIVALFIAGFAALWFLRNLVLLIFSAILVAIVLTSLTLLLKRWVPVGRTAAFLSVSIFIILLIAAFIMLVGAQLASQLSELWQRLPDLIRPLETWLGLENVEEWLSSRVESMVSQTSFINRIAGFSSAAAGVIGNILLVLIAGFYFGFHPQLYLGGVLYLFPEYKRNHVHETLRAAATALQLWLAGQLVAMVVVGLLTFAGLWALGLESALALGFIAGVLEFIPFVGPILAAAPGIAIALSQSPEMALWVTGLYILIQQVEGNVLNPLIQQQTVTLPPAVTLFAVLAFGILFGPLGILLATPLAVLCLVTIKQLWMRDTLDEDVALPGEESALADEERK